jgi:biofilm PGA synthesis protein PgaD
MSLPPEQLHIDCPEILTRRQRFGDTFVTGMMWALYTYLWAPLLSLIAWLLGFEFAYDVMVRAGGIEALLSVLHWYALMVGSIVVVVTGWSLANRIRFGKKERRHSADQVDDKAIADVFHLDSEQLDTLRHSRVIRLSHNDSGGIDSMVETGGTTETEGGEVTSHKQQTPAAVREM